ncbi:MAG: DUF4384 domain-containing protein [Deltaproteobacteria bacterium]|nr:DUF4384 domain-containing protein [Deltaproteobacteria bacterium]
MLDTTGCPNPTMLSALIVEELPQLQKQRLLDHLAQCSICASELELLRTHATEYEARMGDHQARLLQSLEGQGSTLPVRRWLRPSLLALAATVAAISLVALMGERAAPTHANDITFKGALAVEIVAKRGDTQREVKDDTRLRAGDALRLMITTATPGYLTVFSIDGRRAISRWYPERANQPPLSLERSGRHTLAGSIVLDDALGPEQVFVVFSPTSFDPLAIHERAKKLLERDPTRSWRSNDLGVKALSVLTLHKEQVL